ncbi:leucine dehydrogenase [Virgibacillus pantothenticus]|uniref:Leu/Phe/Val dehydrogenase n=1 Tax=Virgibacillus pantothenticus TaxID=1473 RepID=UPI001C22C7A3|nr:Glu/Leu/Phe/Val dehydrogenase dimerization domain-containing protein [Virgibacillus pantothenticus]MBU8565347.1 leucine dehydrogenase [Virgibacillus pantothenticus]MBU8599433.1 leucine dehydrogenase [Virgibacillus pantothenticus]MBU8633667.1 leucine dehydrogenase [Virgibacillus pantothenticus]MBU8641713.1 leucine dehydrogenase [Virgibacillus pantothenticus]MBU8645546.1 leucine dehydrogenase [Virgibacillus pantothenticus]
MKQLEHLQEVDVFQKIGGHEQVVFCNDPKTGLKAIIAIHNTTLGPALGGTRMYPYSSVNAALNDVLRLSEGMTAKCAMSDVDFGGGKAVIIGDPKKDKSPAMFRAFGQFVDSLNGRFYTGTDMGTTMDDFIYAAKETNFINGLPEAFGGSGDTSIPTAQGIIYALQATNQFLFQSNALEGKVYALQGLGKVGRKIALHLLEVGVEVYVTDVNESVINEFLNEAKSFQNAVHVVSPLDIYQVNADVFMPCAMGGVINERTIPVLNVKAVVGSANNQLAHETDAELLHDKGILYAPDYIVNAGGLIQVADEQYGANKNRVLQKTKTIYEMVLQLYVEAQADHITTVEAAHRKYVKQLEEQQNRNNFYSRNHRPKWDIK